MQYGTSKFTTNNFSYLRMKQSHTLTGIHQLLFSHFAASVGLLQSNSKLLDLCQHQTVSALHYGHLLLHVFLYSNSLIKMQLSILEKTTEISFLFKFFFFFTFRLL